MLDMWYGGQEGGNAIADVLFGDADPSGKLPVSFVKQWKDSPAYGHYPGENLQVDYAEGIYVGYRYFDKQKIEPLFPFGYGLSYTKFDYSDLKVSPNEASGQAGRSEPPSAIADPAQVQRWWSSTYMTDTQAWIAPSKS
jgi:hypothetical protein